MQSHRSREIWCKKRSSLLSLLTESNFEESLIHHDDARSGNPLTLTGLDPRFGNGRLLHTTGAASTLHFVPLTENESRPYMLQKAIHEAWRELSPTATSLFQQDSPRHLDSPDRRVPHIPAGG